MCCFYASYTADFQILITAPDNTVSGSLGRLVRTWPCNWLLRLLTAKLSHLDKCIGTVRVWDVSLSLVNCLFGFLQHLKFCLIKGSQKEFHSGFFFWSATSAFLLGFKQTELLNSSVEFTIRGSMSYVATENMPDKVDRSRGKWWLIEKNHTLLLSVDAYWCWSLHFSSHPQRWCTVYAMLIAISFADIFLSIRLLSTNYMSPF